MRSVVGQISNSDPAALVDESEFRAALQSGLGRAILYARENDVRAYWNSILDACLHCYSVDGQSEGTRAGYMLEPVDLLPDRDFYRGEVLKALKNGGDDWDAVQRFHFATYMAFDGDDRAKRAVYENFDPGPRMGEAIGIDFVRMDGLEGFLFAAEKIGALLASKPDAVDEGFLLSQSIELCGEQETLNALRQAGAGNPRIETYRRVAEGHRADHETGQPTRKEILALGYDHLKQRMAELRHVWLGVWGERASAEDLESAARGLMVARTAAEQISHLRIFRRRALPLDHQILLDLVAGHDEQVAQASARALALIAHPSVRDLAFQLVETHAAGRDLSVEMLARNFRAGDHEVALGWFTAEEDRQVQHGFAIGLRRLWDRHPERSSEARMLGTLYENGPCSMCREFVIDRLIELDSFTESMRRECAYDSNDDIRKLVGPPT